jgi:hypothetical protein
MSCPAASLISVPLKNNTNFDIGPYDRTQNVLNIQPVISVHKTGMVYRMNGNAPHSVE